MNDKSKKKSSFMKALLFPGFLAGISNYTGELQERSDDDASETQEESKEDIDTDV